MPKLSRRTFVRSSATAATAGAIGVRTGPAAARARDVAAEAQEGEDWVRVYLIVIDGLRPDEVWQMPTLSGLATDGWYLPDSRAQMLAETTPNHVSMITGMRVDRHGMPGNDVAYLADNIGEEPRFLQADTIFSLIARQSPDLVTAAATAKSYIVNMSRHERVDPGTDDADATNDPFIVPVSGSAIDAEVGPDALRFSQTLDPDLLWMSLGDVDRVGHTDPTGNAEGPSGAAPAARAATLQTADTQVRNLVSALQADGRWARTVVMVTADHSMDWSLPDAIVSLSPAFDAQPDVAGRYDVAQNGGAALYWLRAPAADGAGELLRRMREIAVATEGVAEAWYTAPNPADGDERHWVGAARPDWALTGDRVGDLVVIAADGFRISEPGPTSNPIPGNHGHVVTLPIPQIVAGGWDGLVANDVVPRTPADPPSTVPDDVRADDQGENIDMAPTIAWLLGINPPPGGFDGRVLQQAFSRRPATRLPVADVPSIPRYQRVAGDDRIGTAVALSQLAFTTPQSVPGLVLTAAGATADALSAAPLAAALGGPLLLTDGDRLSVASATEITRLAPERVVVVGGTGVVEESVLEAVRALGVADVVRVAGDDRYGTAAAVAAAVRSVREVTGVILASGESVADALVAGPLAAVSGRVVLLTRPDGLPPQTLQAITDLGVSRVVVLGGPAAVSHAVLTALPDGLVVERLGGADRYATAAAVAERTVREGGFTDRAFLVSGEDSSDALAAGAVVAALGGMLLPLATGPGGDSGAVADLLDRRADGLVSVTVVGGEGAVPAAVVSAVEERILTVRSRPTAAVPTR